MPLYDYSCEEGHTTELRQSIRDRADRILCPLCGKPALRVPFYLSQTVITETGAKSGYARPRANEALSYNQKGQPTGNYAVSRFQEASQELDYQHKKREEEVGRELPAPNYYRLGVERAKRIKNA